MSFPTLSAAIDGYLLAKGAKGLSSNTIRNYKTDLERFAKWLNDPPIDTVTSQQIEGFFQYLNDKFLITHHGLHKIEEPKPLSAKTIQNAWGALNNFWKWATVEFQIDNPFRVPYIKANTKPIDPVSQEEVKQLLKACETAVRKNGDTQYSSRRPTAKRDKAIILTLVDTGMRVSEAANTAVKDVDFKHSRVFVTGKGDKSRYVYFGKICGQALWRYFVERFPGGKAKPTEPFFVCEDGIHQMDRHSILLLIRRLGERVGDTNLHPHRFRHAFAIQFLRNGGNIFELQFLLGHASLTMVQHYARLAEMDLENAAQRSSPADNWRL
jgi:site-specific recombinase XerD